MQVLGHAEGLRLTEHLEQAADWTRRVLGIVGEWRWGMVRAFGLGEGHTLARSMLEAEWG